MKARVTTVFMGRPDAEVMTRKIGIGEIVEGDLARVAVEGGWAEEVTVASRSAKPKPPRGGGKA